MYERVYLFSTENKMIYDLQFGFTVYFSSHNALTNLMENIR